MAPGWPLRRWPLRTLAAATAAAALAVGVRWPAAPSRLHAQEPDLVVARAFDAAWRAHDLEAALACFAPDAVVAFDYGPSGDDGGGPSEYRGASEPFSLRAGVAVLMEAGVRVDPGGLQSAPVVFGGAPATVARWPYQRATLLAALPPEVGTDAVVLREGRILAYTRTPDGASRTARAKALDGAMSAMATRTARPTAAPTTAAPRDSEAADASWPLGLAGLGAGAAVVVTWRRRRAHGDDGGHRRRLARCRH